LGHRQPGTGRANRQSGTRPWIASKAWRSTSLSFSPTGPCPLLRRQPQRGQSQALTSATALAASFATSFPYG
jgi:hypothetical protein